jgi:hypothetical protein
MHKKVYDRMHNHLTSETGMLCLKALGLYALITLVMFWYITVNPFSVVPNGSSDTYQSLWGLWWTPYSIFTLHTSPYSTNLLFYPVGANLVTQTLMPLAGIISAPIQAFSLPLAYNLIFLFGFILSGLFAFMLIYYLTGNRYGAFLGGLIFAFSPMHIAQSIAHLNWASIEFVPLFALLFILTIREKRLLYVVGAALSFLLIVFFGDPLQGIITVIFAVCLIVIYLLSKSERERILNAGFAIRFGEMVIIIAVLGLPFFIPTISGVLQPSTVSAANQLSNTPHFMLWSDNLASYLLPSYYNGIFNGAMPPYFNSIYGLTYQGIQYTPDVSEKVSYVGYSVLLLVIIALYTDYKKNLLRKTLPWLAILLLFGWLSTGPVLQFLSVVTGVPGIYAVYQHIPVLNLVREPGRFDLIVTLCLGILAAIGFGYLTEGKPTGKTRMFAVAFAIVILFEYNGMPFSSSYANMLTANATIPAAYGQIGQIHGNLTVLTLPALPNPASATPELYPAVSMYYQTAMKGKAIIGGYTSRFNSTQQASVSALPLASAVQYLQQGYGLVYPSPILGNSTNVTLLWLGDDNIPFITVIRSAFNNSAQEQLYGYLYSVFGTPVYTDNSTFVFGTAGAVNAHAGRALTAYEAGTWIPGYSFCSSSCNTTLGSMWWGNNARGAIVYAPNSMQVTMNMIAMGYLSSTPLYLYLNNAALGRLNLTGTPQSYSVNFTVPSGISELTFYSPNNTAVPSPYLIYGAKNITFKSQSK